MSDLQDEPTVQTALTSIADGSGVVPCYKKQPDPATKCNKKLNLKQPATTQRKSKLRAPRARPEQDRSPLPGQLEFNFDQ